MESAMQIFAANKAIMRRFGVRHGDMQPSIYQRGWHKGSVTSCRISEKGKTFSLVITGPESLFIMCGGYCDYFLFYGGACVQLHARCASVSELLSDRGSYITSVTLSPVRCTEHVSPYPPSQLTGAQMGKWMNEVMRIHAKRETQRRLGPGAPVHYQSFITQRTLYVE